MDVGVNEAGKNRQTGQVDNVRPGRDSGSAGWTDLDDAIIPCQDY